MLSQKAVQGTAIRQSSQAHRNWLALQPHFNPFSLPLLIFIYHPFLMPDTTWLPGSVRGGFLGNMTLVKSPWLIIEETKVWIINRAVHLFITNFMLAHILSVAHGQFLEGLGWICTCEVCKKFSGHILAVRESYLAIQYLMEWQKNAFGRKFGKTH